VTRTVGCGSRKFERGCTHAVKRGSFLDQACSVDPELRLRGGALLASDESIARFLAKPAMDMGNRRNAITAGSRHLGDHCLHAAPGPHHRRIGRVTKRGSLDFSVGYRTDTRRCYPRKQAAHDVLGSGAEATKPLLHNNTLTLVERLNQAVSGRMTQDHIVKPAARRCRTTIRNSRRALRYANTGEDFAEPDSCARKKSQHLSAADPSFDLKIAPPETNVDCVRGCGSLRLLGHAAIRQSRPDLVAARTPVSSQGWYNIDTE